MPQCGSCDNVTRNSASQNNTHSPSDSSCGSGGQGLLSWVLGDENTGQRLCWERLHFQAARLKSSATCRPGRALGAWPHGSPRRKVYHLEPCFVKAGEGAGGALQTATCAPRSRSSGTHNPSIHPLCPAPSVRSKSQLLSGPVGRGVAPGGRGPEGFFGIRPPDSLPPIPDLTLDLQVAVWLLYLNIHLLGRADVLVTTGWLSFVCVSHTARPSTLYNQFGDRRVFVSPPPRESRAQAWGCPSEGNVWKAESGTKLALYFKSRRGQQHVLHHTANSNTSLISSPESVPREESGKALGLPVSVRQCEPLLWELLSCCLSSSTFPKFYIQFHKEHLWELYSFPLRKIFRVFFRRDTRCQMFSSSVVCF